MNVKVIKFSSTEWIENYLVNSNRSIQLRNACATSAQLRTVIGPYHLHEVRSMDVHTPLVSHSHSIHWKSCNTKNKWQTDEHYS